MKQYIVSYLVTAIVFLGLDVLGLTYLIRPVFEQEIGDLLLEQPDYAAAAVFYLFYVGGVVWFVTVPAVQKDAPAYAVLLQAGLLGGMAYGTYEFTNLATLKGWSWRMVLTDLTWGVFLTGTAGTAGYLAARRA